MHNLENEMLWPVTLRIGSWLGTDKECWGGGGRSWEWLVPRQASHLWLALERITKHDSESNFVSWLLAPTRLWPHNVLLSNGNWVALSFSATCLPPHFPTLLSPCHQDVQRGPAAYAYIPKDICKYFSSVWMRDTWDTSITMALNFYFPFLSRFVLHISPCQDGEITDENRAI